MEALRRPPFFRWILLALVFLAPLAGCDDEEEAGAGTSAAPAAPSVTVAGVASRQITSVYSFVGRVSAVDSIDIVPDEFEADLAAAKAAAAQQQAQLALAEIDLDRNTKLLQSNTIARAQYHASLAQRDATNAQLEAASAQIKLAQLNLDYTRIHAPFAGRIGKIEVSEGDTVGPGVTLTRLVSLSPIDASFSISEGPYMTVVEQIGADALGTHDLSKSPPIRLILPNGKPYGETGAIVLVNNAIDPQTGTISMRARFDNAGRELAPGIYVTVEVEQSATACRSTR
jgi:membrane fusion protein, multidrug efflux system